VTSIPEGIWPSGIFLPGGFSRNSKGSGKMIKIVIFGLFSAV
jgi:hypothetical protein